MLRAFRYPNYRLFFMGQMISLVGTWMTNTASSWLVYRLTGSALLLGAVGFCSQLPAFLLSPLAGLMVDRHNRQRLLILTQILSMLQSFALAILTLKHWITIPWILGLSIFQGLVNAFDMPCRQTFVVEMIENKKDFGNAIALNSSMFNLARLLGPALGGIIIAAFGEGGCFLIDGFSYLAVIAALLAMTVKAREALKSAAASPLQQLKEGLKYAVKSTPIRSMMLLIALVSLVGVPYTVLMPIFARTILGGGPHTLGFLMAASGLGALLGALWLAARKSVKGLSRVIPWAAFVFGVGLVAFSFSKILWLSLILLVITGCGFMLQMASSNTILQTIVEDDKRGRIMSLFVMAFVGTAPFGSLLAGSLSNKIGAPHTLLAGGLCCAAGAVWFHGQLPEIRKTIRPLYVKLGIIAAVASGIETATEQSLLSKEKMQ
ncbi:MAG: MFS transporter [Candidatus Omnitrophica bacterium]|nr:MFS transporter [Candidatus Omnitrophota bacterium]